MSFLNDNLDEAMNQQKKVVKLQGGPLLALHGIVLNILFIYTLEFVLQNV